MKFFRTLSEEEMAAIGPKIVRFRLIVFSIYFALVFLQGVILRKSVVVFFGPGAFFGDGIVNGIVLLLLYAWLAAGLFEIVYGVFNWWPIGISPKGSISASWWVDRSSIVGILLTILIAPGTFWLFIVLTGLLFGKNLWSIPFTL